MRNVILCDQCRKKENCFQIFIISCESFRDHLAKEKRGLPSWFIMALTSLVVFFFLNQTENNVETQNEFVNAYVMLSLMTMMMMMLLLLLLMSPS